MGSVLFDKLELIRALYDFTLLRSKFNQDELFELQVYIQRLCKTLKKGKGSGRQKDVQDLDIRYFDPSVTAASGCASRSVTASGSASASGSTGLQGQTISPLEGTSPALPNSGASLSTGASVPPQFKRFKVVSSSFEKALGLPERNVVNGGPLLPLTNSQGERVASSSKFVALDSHGYKSPFQKAATASIFSSSSSHLGGSLLKSPYRSRSPEDQSVTLVQYHPSAFTMHNDKVPAASAVSVRKNT